MENSTLQKEDVGGIIQQGVSSYLNQNKNISVKDLLTKKSREKAGNQLKTTLKSTALDTGQNIINHLQKNEYQWEEVRRRNKPSNVKKKKRLEYALKNLKQKKDAAIAAGAMKEDIARFDKLVKTIKNTPDLSKDKTARLLAIAGKVRGIKETRIMNSSSIEKSGPTIDVTATEVKDKKKGENAQKRSSALAKRDDKGSTLANRGTKNTEVKPERKPKPYRNKKIKIKGPSKDAINKTVSKVGSAAKKGLSAFTAGYDNENVKESRSFKHFTELAATAAITSPVWAPKVAGALMTAVGAGGMIYNMSKKGTKREDEFSTAPRNVSARQKRNRRKGDEAEARANAQRGSYDKSIQPGDNPEARANIRDMLNKLNKKNNKLYNDYHNPKPPG
jgi:hypothetical protein